MINDISDIAYRIEEISDTRITLVRDAVNRTFRNGGLLIRCLRPTLSIDYAFSAAPNDYIRRFLSCPALARLVPELQPMTPLPNDLTIVPLGRYTLEGEIVQLLLANGMYADSEFDVRMAPSAATNFVDALIGDSKSSVHRVDSHWADWFDGIEWNSITLIVYTDRKWWLICAFDTD